MAKQPDPDDVDLIIDGRNTDPEALRETAADIAAYKARPEYAAEAARAQAILDSIPIEDRPLGRANPQELLEHWRRCVADWSGTRPPAASDPGDSGTCEAQAGPVAGSSPEPALPPSPATQDTPQSGSPNPAGTSS
jgi:hypothetical protein